MIGISYFAIAQIGAAAARPPHLKAIFPFEISPDMYEAAYHFGLFSSSFMSPWLTMIGVTASKSDAFWRGRIANAARRVLHDPRVHRRAGKINGESAKSVLQMIMKAPYAADPWDDLWRAIAVDHQVRDDFWDQPPCSPGSATSISLSTWDVTGTTSRCTCPARSAPGKRWRTTPASG
jgi:hypothetical protein